MKQRTYRITTTDRERHTFTADAWWDALEQFTGERLLPGATNLRHIVGTARIQSVVSVVSEPCGLCVFWGKEPVTAAGRCPRCKGRGRVETKTTKVEAGVGTLGGPRDQVYMSTRP